MHAFDTALRSKLTQNYEANYRDDLDDGEDELRLAISPNAEHVDSDDQEKEDSNPGIVVDGAITPELDRDRCGDDLERQNDKPLQSVAEYGLAT